MLKIRKDFDLEKLKDYGFSNNFYQKIYFLNLQLANEEDYENGEAPVYVSILVNRINDYSRKIFIYLKDGEQDLKELELLDDVYYLPEVLFTMIKDGVIVIE